MVRPRVLKTCLVVHFVAAAAAVPGPAAAAVLF